MVREATEPHAVDCVRACLDAGCLSEVLSKGNSESAAQVQKSSVAKLATRVLHRHGSADRWFSASPRSVMDGPLARVDETMGFKVACCEVAELESRWVTRACLDRSGENGEDVAGATAGVEFSRSGDPRRMINGSEMDYHAHECALGYRRTNSGVDGKKQKEACHRIPHPRRGARRPIASGGFAASSDEVSKEV